MKGYPTLEEIRKDYESLYEKIKDIDTLEKLKTVDWSMIEVNGITCSNDFEIEQDEIDWFRYEEWGCLDYIYVYFENDKISEIRFDVWCEDYETDFIEFTTIEELTKEKYLESIEKTEKFFEIYL